MVFVRKFEQFLFYFLLFAIPFQTRKILWHQNWNFNEWQSISIYGTDILLLILFGFWIFDLINPKIEPPVDNRLRKSVIHRFVKRHDYFLFVLIVVSAISIKNSSSYILSTYSVLKLVEFVVFYFYIKSYAVYKFGLIRSMIVLIYGGLFQAIIAILQFFKQSSLGLGLLGESVISPNLTGIASFYNMAGEKIIRTYGTTPHPNVLAGYLFLAIFAFYYLWIYKNISKFFLLMYGLIILAFFFTFARVAVFLLFINFLVRIILVHLKFKKEYWNKKLALLSVVTVVVATSLFLIYWSETVSRVMISSKEEAVQMRIFYNKESLSSLNWFGVGSGNFVNWLMVKDPNLPRNLYQPVHNIYLLVYSETGILGISAFLMFLLFLIKDFVLRTRMKNLYNYSFLLIFLSVLFMGLFDHFLLTLQQGRFIFWLTVMLLTINRKDDIMIKQQSEPTA
ncbi:MAG: hypothetical protein A3C71_01140 [Candidatus Yanofskybacteria bacterium RIFCSPHIGHO2_02_FULL_43_15c]|uniref:O-antigen ligase-related domain-containing protein n=2 Tax=Candidatus Yanofskyibacteriota TaxID=1752733 RepID=A0A1F8EEJ9_9BACT|nr:MAG: hypothetical protein A2649_03880 [Candidatus Yanofskybacteria bacterium RIFCSPHIGHO2_01_FULL_41_26]OGN11566.1 MAG: hypothetical protein A3C71_01140 [Candidatus Yanofskybacteria bacterium RIFCSPHIGHO2_02_FULL_43_15c]OGN20948.1 MAG: hypothetical protein A2915_02710 [Candidatus Yanofskybacteria bacterium RIFCSPLOWO2_01_FULL_41_34]